MALPSPDSLSLSEAVALVMRRCDCSEDDAKEALRRAGLDRRLEAIGSIPLSAHPDPAIRARHRARRREAVSPADWDSNIDWINGTIGPYFSVSISRASIDDWLGTERPEQSTSTLRRASKLAITKQIRAVYDTAKTTKQKPPNLREIVEPVQRALRAEGCDASGKQIQDLAGAEEFKKRRRKPGTTVRSDQRRQGP